MTTITEITIEQAAATRTAGFAELDGQRDELNRAFAAQVRAAIEADPAESVTSAAKKAGISRQVMHDILRRYPAA